jgi:hypothetical protein
MEYLIIFIIGFAVGYFVGERYDIKDLFIDSWEWIKEKIIFKFYK